MDGHKPALNHEDLSGEHSFNVGDLAVALIRMQDAVAAAVVRVTVLEKNKLHVDLRYSSTPYSAGYLCGRHEGNPVGTKWVWAGDYSKFDPLNGAASTVEGGNRKALTVKIPGALLHPLDAEVESIDVLCLADLEAMRTRNFTQTWGIAHDDLMAVFSAMYERLEVTPLLQLLPKRGKSDTFPYTSSREFVLENATQALSQKQHDDSQKIACFQCHSLIKPDESRAHVGQHILRAMRCVREPRLIEKVALPDPCGFCGRAGCGVKMIK
ncbi:hypothetical protein B0H17DRAFT_1153078 [Mycena rosella]|uniref:Uncharacterized protein n=1 Tax=Mycena rosella TaxID=1033263 RepID=A0AAD7B9B5_MYCRO|nr:hypothetical protein B0H17DRAFT_1153078 [Mycena rosella]